MSFITETTSNMNMNGENSFNNINNSANNTGQISIQSDQEYINATNKSIAQSNFAGTTSNLNINMNTNFNKQKSNKMPIYLILFEQYVDINKVRVNNDNKIKIKVYQID